MNPEHDAFMQGLRRLDRDTPSFSIPDVEYPDEYSDEFEEWEDDAEEEFHDSH